ncbi:MAG: DEAD/DEAH box helicase [Candidatus Omnitrophota bacterium]
MSFSLLGISKDLLRSVELAGYEKPTEIQREAIPVILKGQDLIAQAKTGSGKTISFVLPILQSFENSRDPKRRILKVLILTPTRELAMQVAGVLKVFGRSLPNPPRTILLLGGLNINLQIIGLHHGADIAVATPGRLLDIINRKEIGLASLTLLVIDEADKLLDMGFAKEVDEVLKALPVKRQNILFSATMGEKVSGLTQRFMKCPVHVKAEDATPTVETIHQRAIEVNRNNRGPLLRHLINTEGWGHVLIFVASVRGADILAAKLRRDGVVADALHGGMTQAQRTVVLSDFKAKKTAVLVSTDIIARGIDIDKLSYVVNYDLPRSPNDYIHRIGRTARAGEHGIAVSFIGLEDKAHFSLIEKRVGTRLIKESIKGFELTGEVILKEKGKAPVKGHRMSKKDKARALALKEGRTL